MTTPDVSITLTPDKLTLIASRVRQLSTRDLENTIAFAESVQQDAVLRWGETDPLVVGAAQVLRIYRTELMRRTGERTM